MKLWRWFRLMVGCGLAAAVMNPAAVRACSVCIGDAESPLAKGMSLGVLTLLLVVVFVLGGIGAFFIYLARRAALAPPPPEPAAPPAGSR